MGPACRSLWLLLLLLLLEQLLENMYPGSGVISPKALVQLLHRNQTAGADQMIDHLNLGTGGAVRTASSHHFLVLPLAQDPHGLHQGGVGFDRKDLSSYCIVSHYLLNVWRIDQFMICSLRSNGGIEATFLESV